MTEFHISSLLPLWSANFLSEPHPAHVFDLLACMRTAGRYGNLSIQTMFTLHYLIGVLVVGEAHVARTSSDHQQVGHVTQITAPMVHFYRV